MLKGNSNVYVNKLCRVFVSVASFHVSIFLMLQVFHCDWYKSWRDTMTGNWFFIVCYSICSPDKENTGLRIWLTMLRVYVKDSFDIL